MLWGLGWKGSPQYLDEGWREWVARIWSAQMIFVDVTLTRYARPMRKRLDRCWHSHAPEAHERVSALDGHTRKAGSGSELRANRK
jgi:hypothetical protein